MRKLVQSTIALYCLLVTGYSSAYGYLTNYDGPGVTIQRYFIHNEGGISLILNENLPHNPDGCNTTNHVYIKNDKPGHKMMISAALAAFAAGKSIGLHGYGCEIIPFWGGTQTRPTVSELWVFQ